MTNVPIMSEFRVVRYTCMGVPDFPERIFDRGGDIHSGGQWGDNGFVSIVIVFQDFSRFSVFLVRVRFCQIWSNLSILKFSALHGHRSQHIT